MSLAAHPAAQDAVRAELHQAGLITTGSAAESSVPLTYEALTSLPYLNAAIKEAMRMYPATAIGASPDSFIHGIKAWGSGPGWQITRV